MAKKTKKHMTIEDAQRIAKGTINANGGQIPQDSFAKRAIAAANKNNKLRGNNA
ncbi:MAG: hypothetical protein PHI97_09090 [Desulfobulbus sp.]|nr:hypothetical protein [Desulfobulbus sp.]